KCEICGKVIEILESGVPNTMCCGKPMKLMEAKTAEWKEEKHVPHVEIDGNKVTVDVGITKGTPHPMKPDHYIMWIEIICKNGYSERKFLKPGDEPKATFVISEEVAEGLTAREYCNMHGLWSS
ncbi:MAG: desulfoferrodoxin family protein, partial [Promethearchaeota archaeon]